MADTFEGLAHFDNKFFRTLKSLILRPGQLALDYTEGRRVRFMKPIQFFLVVNLIFFFGSLSNPFSIPLKSYLRFKPFTDYQTAQILDNKLHQTSLPFTAFEQLFNERMNYSSKELIFLFIPFYALLFLVLLFPKKKGIVEHLVFATYFVGFILVYFLAEFYLINLPFFYSPDRIILPAWKRLPSS